MKNKKGFHQIVEAHIKFSPGLKISPYPEIAGDGISSIGRRHTRYRSGKIAGNELANAAIFCDVDRYGRCYCCLPGLIAGEIIENLATALGYGLIIYSHLYC